MADDDGKKTELRAKRDVIGGVVDGSGNTIAREIINYKLEGPTINIIGASDSVVEALRQIHVVKTEIPANRDEAVKDSRTVQELAETKRNIDDLLQKMSAIDGKLGETTGEIRAGTVTISKVELLIKKAIALKAESTLAISDYLERNQTRINSCMTKMRSGGYSSQDAYYADLFKDFDYASFKAKLNEASGYLDEAGKLDRSNVEVPLNKIETLSFLAANAPQREWPSIYESISHLAATVVAHRQSPKDDLEGFQLAQATYYQAFSRLSLYGRPQEREVLLDARTMFEKLGRRDWVRQCDLILEQFGGTPVSGAYQPGMETQAQPGYAQGPGQFQGLESPGGGVAGFQPHGTWRIAFGDGSAALVTLSPDGTFQGTVTMMGANHEVVGRWAFIPTNQLLQFQGLIDGYVAFNNAIVIQREQGDGYFGVDSTGDTCVLTRA